MRAFVLLCLVLTACPPALRRPESSQLVVTGTLVAGGFATRGELVTNARVTLRRADTGEELASNTSSTAGGYRLTTTVPAKTRVVLIAEADGFAPIARAFTVGPFTELTISAAMPPLVPLECVDTQCDAPLVDLQWAEPPSGASGAAASFEQESPIVVDIDATQPRILAMGYAALDGGSGGTLRLRVPLENQSALVDAMLGNGTLEVTAARFDVTKAAWTKLTASLEAENGLPIPESALPALQRLEYAGGAVAVFPMSNASFLAVLGAGPALGCVTGTVEADGKPAEGATFSTRDQELVATASDGTFCAAARIGTDKTPSSGQYAGLPYALGGVATPTTAGVCGGTCTPVGTLQVLPDALQLAAMCKFTGKVIDAQGNTIANAEVVAFDESVTGNAVVAFCGKTGTRCSLATPSGADGTFKLNVPLLNSVFVGARVSASSAGGEAQRSTGQHFESCPNEPLTLKLNHGVDRLEVSATFTGSQVNWLPPRAASRVTVLDGAGLPKWEVAAPGGLMPPLTFGTVPAEAEQTTAPTGVASSGDSVVVEFEGLGRDGVVYVGTGTGVRP